MKIVKYALSNGSPVDIHEDGSITLKPGGLVSGVMSGIEPGTEVHWTFFTTDPNFQEQTVDGIHLHPVLISKEENQEHYSNHANGRNWAIAHEMQDYLPDTVPYEWDANSFETTKRVQKRMAKKQASLQKNRLQQAANAGEKIQILNEAHDYQISLVPGLLRSELQKTRSTASQKIQDGFDRIRIGYFQHSRFPKSDHIKRQWKEWPIEAQEAYRLEIEGILGADYAGCHIPDYAANFLNLAEWLELVDGNQISELKHHARLAFKGREVIVEANQIGVDVEEREQLARNADMADQLVNDITSEKFTLEYVLDSSEYSDAVKQLVQEISEVKRIFWLEKKLEEIHSQITDFEPSESSTNTLDAQIKSLADELNSFRNGHSQEEFDKRKEYQASLSPQLVREKFGCTEDTTLFVSIERFEYTKAIDLRLKAIKEMIENGEFDNVDVKFVFVAPPLSRMEIQAYENYMKLVKNLHAEIEELRPGMVHLVFENHDKRQAAALFRAGDIALMTPFCDGSNMAVQEFISSCYENMKVVVISKTIGAAKKLTTAIQVEPTIEGVKQGIRDALKLRKDPEATRNSMEQMRRAVEWKTVRSWARSLSQGLQRKPDLPQPYSLAPNPLPVTQRPTFDQRTSSLSK